MEKEKECHELRQGGSRSSARSQRVEPEPFFEAFFSSCGQEHSVRVGASLKAIQRAEQHKSRVG